MSLCVSTSESLSGPLHRKAQFVKQTGHMVVVVPNAETALDEIADHGSGPDSGAVSRGLRPGLDERCQFEAALLAEPRGWARRDACAEPADATRLKPLEPAVHGATSRPSLPREIHDSSPLDVAQHRSPTPPLLQIAGP